MYNSLLFFGSRQKKFLNKPRTLSLVENKNIHTGGHGVVTVEEIFLEAEPQSPAAQVISKHILSFFTETESTLIACLAVLVCFKDHRLSVSILQTLLSISLRLRKPRLRPRLQQRLKQTARRGFFFKRELSACFGNGSGVFLDRHDSKSAVLNP